MTWAFDGAKLAATDEFRAYAKAIVDNSHVLADTLTSRGFDLVTGGSDNHLILIDLTSKDVPGKVAAQALDRAGMVANYNSVPFDTRKPFDPSGVRLGTPAITQSMLRLAAIEERIPSNPVDLLDKPCAVPER